LEASKGCIQPGRVVQLDGAGSALLVPKDEHGLQSVPAWVEFKLYVWYLAF